MTSDRATTTFFGCQQFYQEACEKRLLTLLHGSFRLIPTSTDKDTDMYVFAFDPLLLILEASIGVESKSTLGSQ